MKTLEFYYDFASPMAYLGYFRLLKMQQSIRFTVHYKPILLGALHKGSGNVPPGLVPAKGDFMLKDIERHSAYYDIPFQFNEYFPVNCISALRGAIFLGNTEGESCFKANDICKNNDQNITMIEHYLRTMFIAVWRDNKNIADTKVFESVLEHAGLDSVNILKGIQDFSVKDQLKCNTEEALQRGAFGAPTFYLDDEMYFGQDRLDFIERALME